MPNTSCGEVMDLVIKTKALQVIACSLDGVQQQESLFVSCVFLCRTCCLLLQWLCFAVVNMVNVSRLVLLRN